MDALLVERPERDLAGRRVGAEVALGAPAVDGGGQGGVGVGKACGERLWLARDGGAGARGGLLLGRRLLGAAAVA